MIDVQVGVCAPAGGDVVEEVEQRPAFLAARMGPPRPEPRRRRRTFDDAEQVLQPPVRASVLGPQRVAFEVEEDVPRIRGGQRGQHLRGEHLHHRLLGVLLAQLDRRLGPQRG